jgi:hypothetical protein
MEKTMSVVCGLAVPRCAFAAMVVHRYESALPYHSVDLPLSFPFGMAAGALIVWSYIWRQRDLAKRQKTEPPAKT